MPLRAGTNPAAAHRWHAGDAPADRVPSELRSLLTYQALQLHDDHWDRDVDALARVLVDTCRFFANDVRVVLPHPQIRITGLSEQALEDELLTLSGWEPVESMIPGDYPNSRCERERLTGFDQSSGLWSS